MNTPGVFTDEQQELRASAKRFLQENSGSEAIRSAMESTEGFDEATWKQMSELGWMGIAIPEEYGGAGYTFTELGVLLEEMGRANLAAPFFSSVVLGAEAVLNAGTEEQRKDLLPKLADGSTRATLAFTEESGRWDATGITLAATQKDGGYALNGTKMYVLDGHTATVLVVAARLGDDIELFLVDADADGLTKTPLDTLDMSRKQAKVDFSSTPATLLGQAGGGAAALERTLQQAAVGLAAEMVGGAQWCLDTATEHANTRVQFGRPIGSFQAVKHKCAEMLIEVEMAKSAAYYSAWAVSEDESELPVAASLAKSYCSEAFFDVAGKTIQVLGGIGFTWEHDVHLYFRRAKSSEIYLGDGDYHRDVLARLTDIGGDN
ncbi:MAG TPA: acyl-CoA dehydrogenase family protein [Actinomycetota bacterium]|nr:acyl-CoA dehydrogenase family protein [Actinomycetota bacterium]